jgi:ankyrin repeat protein
MVYYFRHNSIGSIMCKIKNMSLFLLLLTPIAHAGDFQDETATIANFLHEEDIYGNTPLMYAVDIGDLKSVKSQLAEPGTNIHAKNEIGLDALLFAVHLNRDDMVELLIKAGADVNSKALNGKTALMIATGQNNLKIAKLLLGTNKVKVNSVCANRRTALFWAYMNNTFDIFEVLVKAGAKASVPDQLKDSREIGISYICDYFNGLKRLEPTVNDYGRYELAINLANFKNYLKGSARPIEICTPHHSLIAATVAQVNAWKTGTGCLSHMYRPEKYDKKVGK